MAAPKSLSVTDLLAHARHVRALAKSLVDESGRAEDLEQEAWVAALHRPPESPKVLPKWFSVVLRNRSRREHRDSRRRASAYGKLAASETAEDASLAEAEAAFERMALRTRISEEVLRLPEPDRTMILLRYFEQVPPAEIARRLGISPEAQRKRQQRALARLRERLEQIYGGEWRVHCLSLIYPLAAPLPLAPPVVGESSAGLVGLLRAAALPAAAAAAALAVFWIAAGSGRQAEDAAPETAAVRSGRNEPTAAPSIAAEEAERGTIAAASESPPPWHLRVVDQDGAVLPGATVRWMVAPTESSWIPHLLQACLSSESSAGSCNQEGILPIADFAAGETLCFVASAPGCAPRWRVLEHPAAVTGEELSLTIALGPAGVIALRIEDEDGAPVADARLVASHWAEARPDSLLFAAAASDAGGRAELRDLELGCYKIDVRRAGYLSARIQLDSSPAGAAGGEARVVLRRGASIGGVLLDGDGLPLERVAVRAVEVRPDWDSEWPPIRMERFADAPQDETDTAAEFLISGLQRDARYRLEARHGEYWAVSEPAAPGSWVTLRTVAPGVVTGRLAWSDGAPASGAEVAFRRAGDRSAGVPLTSAADGRFAGRLAAGNYELRVTHADGRLAVDDLRVPERGLDLGDLTLPRCAMVTIVAVSGDPERGVSELKFWPLPPDQVEILAPDRALVHGLRPGEHHLTVRAHGFASSALDLTLAAGEHRTETVNLLPEARGELEVAYPDGTPVARQSFAISNAATPGGASFALEATDDHGLLRLQALTPGRHSLTRLRPLPKVELGEFDFVAGDNRWRAILPLARSFSVMVTAGELPVSGARVRLWHPSVDLLPGPPETAVAAMTDASGCATFEDLALGEYRLEVCAAGAAPQLLPAVAVRNDGAPLVIALAGAPLHGQVVPARAGAQVLLVNAASLSERTPEQLQDELASRLFDSSYAELLERVPWLSALAVACSDDGSFVVPQVAPGTYFVTATAPGHGHASLRRIEHSGASAAPLALELPPGAGLRFVIAEGADPELPPGRQALILELETPDGERWLRHPVHGWDEELAGLPPGPAMLRVCALAGAEAAPLAAFPLQLVAGQTAEVVWDGR